MAATNLDVDGASEWRIDDALMQLRVWGTEVVYPLPPTQGAWTIGVAEGCWLRLEDPTLCVSRRHATLAWLGGRWVIKDLGSTNGVRQDGARRDEFALVPGVEIGIGGVTLIAESPLSCALRQVLARLLGWAEERRAEVDLALRAVRMAATRRGTLLLCGDGDLVSIARLLHRHALGEDRPFVVCDPRRRPADPSARTAANFDNGALALAAAGSGTLCVWQNRQPRKFTEVVAAIRTPASRVQLVVCTHTLLHGESLIASPIVVPPLEGRASELHRIIDAYMAEAVADLGGTFQPADRVWIRTHEAATLAEIEVAARRLAALRGARGSVTRAATQLGMSRAALSEWVARRALPDGDDEARGR